MLGGRTREQGLLAPADCRCPIPAPAAVLDQARRWLRPLIGPPRTVTMSIGTENVPATGIEDASFGTCPARKERSDLSGTASRKRDLGTRSLSVPGRDGALG